MSLLLRSLLLCLLLTSSISSDPSPSCRSLSDSSHQLPQKELEGRWYLFYSAAHQSGVGTIISSVLDFHVTDNDHAQVRQVIKHNHLVRIEGHEMQITTTKNNSYTLTAKDDDHKFTVYPMKDHVILYEEEDGVRLFSQSNTTAYSSEQEFRNLSECLGYTLTNVHVISTPDPIHSDQDCQDYQPISKPAAMSEILGEKTLYLSAYTSKEYAKWDEKLKLISHSYEHEGEKLKGKYSFCLNGSLQHYQSTAHVEEENGKIIIRDSNITMKAYNLGDSCVGFTAAPQTASNHTGYLGIYCGSGAVSDEDIQKFVHYAKCQKFPYIMVREDSAKLAFSNRPLVSCPVHITKEEEMVGHWECVLSFFNYYSFTGQWVQFEDQDGQLMLTNSSFSCICPPPEWFSKGDRGKQTRFICPPNPISKDDRGKQSIYPIPVTLSRNTMTLRPEPEVEVNVMLCKGPYDYILAYIYVNCPDGKYHSRNVFSKSGKATAEEIERVRQMVFCMSHP